MLIVGDFLKVPASLGVSAETPGCCRHLQRVTVDLGTPLLTEEEMFLILSPHWFKGMLVYLGCLFESACKRRGGGVSKNYQMPPGIAGTFKEAPLISAQPFKPDLRHNQKQLPAGLNCSCNTEAHRPRLESVA